MEAYVNRTSRACRVFLTPPDIVKLEKKLGSEGIACWTDDMPTGDNRLIYKVVEKTWSESDLVYYQPQPDVYVVPSFDALDPKEWDRRDLPEGYLSYNFLLRQTAEVQEAFDTEVSQDRNDIEDQDHENRVHQFILEKLLAAGEPIPVDEFVHGATTLVNVQQVFGSTVPETNDEVVGYTRVDEEGTRTRLVMLLPRDASYLNWRLANAKYCGPGPVDPLKALTDGAVCRIAFDDVSVITGHEYYYCIVETSQERFLFQLADPHVNSSQACFGKTFRDCDDSDDDEGSLTVATENLDESINDMVGGLDTPTARPVLDEADVSHGDLSLKPNETLASAGQPLESGVKEGLIHEVIRVSSSPLTEQTAGHGSFLSSEDPPFRPPTPSKVSVGVSANPDAAIAPEATEIRPYIFREYPIHEIDVESQVTEFERVFLSHAKELSDIPNCSPLINRALLNLLRRRKLV